MLSLTWAPVCVLCASLHYYWHLWFHALHTLHGRSFSSSDSGSLLSPPFITHPLCSITILINLTSAHIRTAVSFKMLRCTLKRWQTDGHCRPAFMCNMGPLWKWESPDAQYAKSQPHKYKQMSVVGLMGKCASFYLLWMALTASLNYANLIRQTLSCPAGVWVRKTRKREVGKRTLWPLRVSRSLKWPFYSFPSKWSGVWLRQLWTRMEVVG